MSTDNRHYRQSICSKQQEKSSRGKKKSKQGKESPGARGQGRQHLNKSMKAVSECRDANSRQRKVPRQRHEHRSRPDVCEEDEVWLSGGNQGKEQKVRSELWGLMRLFRSQSRCSAFTLNEASRWRVFSSRAMWSDTLTVLWWLLIEKRLWEPEQLDK